MRFLIFMFLVFYPFVSWAQNGPSFDCNMAKKTVEKQICSSFELSKKDVALNKLYKIARSEEYEYLKTGQIAAQSLWLKVREICANNPQSAINDCLNTAYNVRNRDLAVAIMFKDPKLAFEQLQIYSPQKANLYLALYEFIEKPKSSTRDSKIADLIGPYFHTLFNEMEYPKAILEDEKIISPKDALISDDKFFETLAFISMIYDEPFTIPCTAIIKNPKALKATYPYFGSSMDGQLPYSDCAVVLPVLPQLDNLTKKMWKAAPECSGTIRFSIWRDLYVQEDKIRLGRYEFQGKKQKFDTLTLKFKNKNASVLQAASIELSNYYNKTKFKSGISAKSAQNILLDYIDRAMQGGC